MKKLDVLLLGGTKDSINIIKHLKSNFNTYILTTTTTNYGATLAIKGGTDDSISKPLLKNEILNLLDGKSFDLIIDATHPFATHITKTAIECSEIAKIPYIRFERPTSDSKICDDKKVHCVNSFIDAGKLIQKKWNQYNVLHLAGSHTIEDVLENVSPSNFYPRILNLKSSLEICEKLKIPKKNIFFMNGASSEEENIDLIKKVDAKVIITKDSGEVGGLSSKINASKKTGIDIIIINRPEILELKKETVVNNLDELTLKIQKTSF